MKSSPEASQEMWSYEENRKLFGLYYLKKNHWKEISKEFGNRSDNSAKNQFFAMIRKGLRKACRSIGMMNNTAKINMIKPRVLLDFFETVFRVECNNTTLTIRICKLIEYYCLTERPLCSLYDNHKKEIISQLIGQLTRNK